MMIDDDKLMAFADGELPAAEREEMERALAVRPDLRARIEEQRRLRHDLRAHYGPVASEEVPEHLLAMLGASGSGTGDEDNVASLATARARRRSWSKPLVSSAVAAAAAFVIGIVAGPALLNQEQGPIAVQGETLVAQGDLRQALETQLASAQPADAAHRIGVTFENEQGDYCRTFEGADVSGLACRKGGTWAVAVAEGGAGTGASLEYRQAGSSTIMAAAQERMASAPLDAAAERAVIESGWKK